MKSFFSAAKISLAVFSLSLAASAGSLPFNPPRLASQRPVEVLVTVPRGLSARARSSGLMALQFGDSKQSLWEESSFIGLPSSFLQYRFEAQPVGLVNRINTMIYHVPAERQEEMVQELKAKGYEADAGGVIALPRPIVGPARSVGLKEIAQIIGSDKLQAEIERVIGKGNPEKNPVIPWALMDTYMKSDSHPFLKGRFVQEVGGKPDGQIHGFHVAGITIGMDRSNYHGYAFNIFPNGSASEGDILLKLEMAVAKAGALATGNSWGDTSGQVSDRFMPAAKGGSRIATLMEKQALELGVHHSISAGNEGSRPNTIGGPAIATAQVDLVIHGKKIGVVDRISAIAATDAGKNIAGFSSRGKLSPWAAQNNKDGRYNNYPRRPTRAAIGVNVISAVPPGNGYPVEELDGGPGKALSGTSMSRPEDQGAADLQLARAILVLLGDYLPKMVDRRAKVLLALDLAAWAGTQSAKMSANDSDETKYGNGFINVWDAFELSAATLKAAASQAARTLADIRGYGNSFINRLEFAADGVRIN